MPLTSAQISSVLQISSTASLINGTAVITDVSNYASIGITSGDTVKVLLWIQDPTGNTFYKNSGYDAANYASPDLLPLTTPTSYSFTLPTYTTGAYVQGQYNVNFKVQVTQGSDITEASKQLYMNVCGCCNGIEANVQGNVSYNTAIVSVVDNTSYGTWTSLTNVLVIQPPVGGGASQTGTFHGSPATLTFVPPMGTYPYTGTWQWTLNSTISYTDPLSQTTTTCLLTGQGSFSVIQSQLCKVRCLLDKYRTDLFAAIKVKPNPTAERNYLMAEADYLMASASERCALPQTTIDKYIDSIYVWTGIDPNCECGCSDGTAQPLVPTSIINGTNGTNGSQILFGSGAPAGGTGAVGDTYINTANGFVYKKTGASTWAYELTIIGGTGATGASGTSLIKSDPVDHLTTTNGSFEVLSSFSTDHTDATKNLVAVGDTIKLYSLFTPTTTPTATGILVKLNLNGTGISNVAINAMTITNASDSQVELITDVILKDATAGAMYIRVNSEIRIYDGVGYFSMRTSFPMKVPISDIGGATVDFSANNYTFSAQAQSIATGDIECQIFQAEKLKKI